MIITLIVLSLLLGGYSLYLLRKLDKKLNLRIYNNFNYLKTKLYEKGLYLLDELDNKIKTSEELLLSKLKETNNQNQKDNDKKHQQLISGEFKELRSDLNKDLNSIVTSVKNIKIF